ncbi:SEL1-like repeat protein [Candidatus Coxiella mudrowiae]|uniref:tetratricopeptide repeat protein n=1 Tax=Candidatus Coxiella mudrowiae TaxID=2054173 RepID=UPI000C289672
MRTDIYDNSFGVQKDSQTAFQYYLKFSEQEDFKDEYELGLFYLQGKVVSQDSEKAINWLIQSALKGSSQAQFFFRHYL